MKRSLAYIISITVLFSMLTACTAVSGDAVEDGSGKDASVVSLAIGDYILLGKYSDAPILWRYVADDENGKLILSDKLLCEKVFGPTNFWAESKIREWLNSDVPEGEVEWGFDKDWGAGTGIIDIERFDFDKRGSRFDWEKGFLNEDNFSLSERAVMKPVIQWTMLPFNHLDLAENGEAKPYTGIKGIHQGGPFSEPPAGEYYYPVHELPEAYVGAAHQLEDTVFLLDEMQVCSVWRNFSTVDTVFTPGLNILPEESYKNGYRLRTPSQDRVCDIDYLGRYGTKGDYGIRPAFYLNEATTHIVSGSGTAEDPYVLGGKNAVFVNGKPLSLDVLPMLENDRVLVPLRAVFEALDAQIYWDEEARTITATRDGTTVFMQIDDWYMAVNDEWIRLDVPPRIVNDRTLIPLRAVAEAFGAQVGWDEATLNVTVAL